MNILKENGQEYLISSMTFTYINMQLDLVVEYILPKALLKGGQQELTKYINFLKAGSSKNSIEILKDAEL